MRSLTLLLLASLAAAAAPRPASASVSAGEAVGAVMASHAAPHLLVAAGSLVEPADADSSAEGVSLSLGVGVPVTNAPESEAPRRPVSSPEVRGSPPHLLARESHPSTAPPFLHA